MNNSRWKNYGLWISIASLIPLILQSFNIELIPNYQEIVNGVLGVLVLAGIINNPTTDHKGFHDDSSTK